MCSSDLELLDDTYLIVSSNNSHTVEAELHSIEQWALKNNLTLNKSKSVELIIYSSERAKANAPPCETLPGIQRAEAIKILGVTIQSNLSMSSHVNEVIQSSSQALYALKMLKAHGLDSKTIQLVCQATVISRLTYASPSWWGFTSSEDRQRLESVVNKAVRWGFYDSAKPNLDQICKKREYDLFKKVLSNPYHVLHHLLPPVKASVYNLRERVHNRQLPNRGGALLSKTFVQRMIYKDAY